jgi:hypothetical protein
MEDMSPLDDWSIAVKRIALTAAFVAVAVVCAAARSSSADASTGLRSAVGLATPPVADQRAGIVRRRADGAIRRRVARSLPIDDPTQDGEWIADVERPAGQYRGRYELRLEDARDLLGTKA